MSPAQLGHPFISVHFGRVSTDDLAKVLESLGCPAGKSSEMAAQLDKRARQLSEQKNRSYDEALTHLLELLRQGWAAKERGL